MVLFINACVRKGSRTKLLADYYLKKLDKPFEELRLEELDLFTVDEKYLESRDKLISEKIFDHPSFKEARRFADADEIVIAAPFWDLSFPAALKRYFEIINVVGITFVYTEQGVPKGLCRAKKITYITTSGGDFFPEEYGFGYIKALARGFYGINDVKLIKATGLDIIGADVAGIIGEAKNEIDKEF